MAKVPLSKLIKFYVRFTPSYSALGYHLRLKARLRKTPRNFRLNSLLHFCAFKLL